MTETREPFDENHYDSRAEEAIDWYQHYKSIEARHLLAEYISCQTRDNRTVSDAMQMAVETRRAELEKAVAETFE
jgi:hypothetical protein